DFFSLTPYQKLMWLASEGRWHGIARLDAFLLEDGRIQICEMNSDTPSGEPEATVVNELRSRYHPDLVNPNAEFEEKFIRMVETSYRATLGDRAGGHPSVGIIY